MTSEASHASYSPIHNACRLNDICELERLLTADPSLANAIGLGEHTFPCRPIHNARSPEAVDILVAHGASVCALPDDICSPLESVLRRGYPSAATRLAKIDPSIVAPAMRLKSGQHLIAFLTEEYNAISWEHGICYSSRIANSIAWAAKQECVDLFGVDEFSGKSLIEMARPIREEIAWLLEQIACARADIAGVPVPRKSRREIETAEDSDDSLSEAPRPRRRGAAALELLNVQIADWIQQNFAIQHCRLHSLDPDPRVWPSQRVGMPVEPHDPLLCLHWRISLKHVHVVEALLKDPTVVSRINERIPNAVMRCSNRHFYGKIYCGLNAIEQAIPYACDYKTIDGKVTEFIEDEALQILNLLVNCGASVDCGLAFAVQKHVPSVARYFRGRGGRFTNERCERRRTPLGMLLTEVVRKDELDDDPILKTKFHSVMATWALVVDELDPIDIDALTETRASGKVESLLQTFHRLRQEKLDVLNGMYYQYTTFVGGCLLECRAKYRHSRARK